nr:hypothetical protein [Desulfobacula sp.]
MKHLSFFLIILLFFAGLSPVARAGTQEMENLGRQAVAAAQEALAPHPIEACLTNVGWANLENQPCHLLFDVFSGQAGVSVGRGSLLPVHGAWTDAPWAAFITRPSPEDLILVLVRITAQGPVRFGPLNVRVVTGTDFTPFEQVLGKEAFALVTLANGWADKVPPRVLAGSLFHDHLCCGVFTGYFTTQYILDHFPLTGTQDYIYIGIPAWCQDDLIMTGLNLTPGKHGYVTMTYPWNRPWKTDKDTYENLGGIIIRRDSRAGGGQAWVLAFDWQAKAFRQFAGLEESAPLDWKHQPWLHVVYNRFFTARINSSGDFVSVVRTRKLETAKKLRT